MTFMTDPHESHKPVACDSVEYDSDVPASPECLSSFESPLVSIESYR